MTRKHAIIIGGTKGVGRELAAILAADGQHVTAVGRTPGAFPEVSGGQIEGLVGDVENPDALLAALKERVGRRGKVSSLVFLQRYRGQGDTWAGELAVSLTATKTLIDGLVAEFHPAGDRAICVVTSGARTLVARHHSLGYHTTTAAMGQVARFSAR